MPHLLRVSEPSAILGDHEEGLFIGMFGSGPYIFL